MPKLAWLMLRLEIWLALTPWVTKPSEPSKRLLPWNCVVWEIWSMAFSEESISCWLAWIWSEVMVPVLAAAEIRPRMLVNSVVTWVKAVCGRGDHLVGLLRLLTACWVLAISLPNASLAIRPDGSSAALLIRKPVLKRVNACWSD